jgi:hypothetical protein
MEAIDDDQGQLNNDEFGEAALPQGEFVLMIARGVGFLVAIVAVVMAVLLMISVRAFIAFSLTKLGILGLSTLVGIIVWAIVRFGNINPKSIWVILSRSCM